MNVLDAISAITSQPRAASSATNSGTNGTSNGSSTGSSNPPNPTDQLTKESTFLNLLVAQIKNQDPLNPTDSIQFVGQLVQFSQLEQLLSINQGVTALAGSQGTSTTSAPQPTRS